MEVPKHLGKMFNIICHKTGIEACNNNNMCDLIIKDVGRKEHNYNVPSSSKITKTVRE